MNKIFASSLVALVALGANVAAAQSYYYPTTSHNAYPSAYVGGCVNLVSDLYFGSRGSQVSQLQTFLVSRNFPGAGSWMVTGYFGRATQAAVQSFQQQQGLPMTGFVDAATRAAISRVSCGGYSNTYPYTNYNNNYNYNTNCSYPYTNYNTNSYVYGPYGYAYSQTGQQMYGSYGYNYCPPNTSHISISKLSPNSGDVGSKVTIRGSGFSSRDNTVLFGGAIITNLKSSNDGEKISFTVPDYLTGYSSQPIFPGIYNVSVSNNIGAMSNSLPFTVTSGGTSDDIELSSISPMSARVGTQIMLKGDDFNSFDNTVHFGIGGTQHVPSFDNGTTIYYTVPSFVSPCDLATSGTFCTQNIQQVLPGPIQVYVSNSNGITNTILFQVTN